MPSQILAVPGNTISNIRILKGRALFSPAPIKVALIKSSPSQVITIHIQAKPMDESPGDESAACGSSSPSSEAGPSSESLPVSLPPLKLSEPTTSQASDPAPHPHGNAKPEPSLKGGDASSIAVETHHASALGELQDEVPGFEFQKGFQMGLQGIEGLNLNSEPKDVLGGPLSRST
jgi:hypothetical protein